jgi:tetratricopeptide (TPR) repeat protein
MKLKSLIFISFGLVSFATLQAQEPEAIDEIVVTGTKQMDPAMSAWLAGDYATAEIEFDRNAFCALRAERNFRSGVEDARDSTIRSDVTTDANSAPQPTGGPGAGGGLVLPTAPTVAPSATINSTDFQKSEAKDRRTCENRGYQMYMKGMSQLKLGKMAEAKNTLTRATKIHRTIYDAHFRLSLMDYQDGDIKNAKKEFKALKKIAARCKRCEAKEEIQAQVKFLENLLQ